MSEREHEYCVLDVESTIYAKGHPYSARNKLCLVGLRIAETNHIFKIEYDEEPYGERLTELRRLIDSCRTIVGFNLKFDLGLLARYGINPKAINLFDCQLAEFILSHQLVPYPSLNHCLAKYGLGSKLDIVEREYWAHEIDTPQIPLDILTEYLATDLEKTDALYQTLLRRCGDPLYGLHMQDLRVLLEMERNGLQFDWGAMEHATSIATQRLAEINRTIQNFVPESAREWFNTRSGDHLSKLLYGGYLSARVAVRYQHIYKTGPKAGICESRNRWESRVCELERLVQPPEGSNLKKEGFFSVDED